MKTESNVSVFWWPEESDDVTSHVVLSSTSPSAITTTGFTLSTTVLNWQKELQWGVKVAPREVYFCNVSCFRQIRSIRKFNPSSFLLTELKSPPNRWSSWCPYLWQVLRYWLYTREQFRHISDEASGCSWMERCFLMFNTLSQPIRSLSHLYKQELKNLGQQTTITLLILKNWPSHVTLTRSGLLLDGWKLLLSGFVFSAVT